MLKSSAFAFAFAFSVFLSCMAHAQPYEEGYEKRAQDVIHNLIVNNGLAQEQWPDYQPSLWPLISTEGLYEKRSDETGVHWSQGPVRRLTHLVIRGGLKGAVDLSGLTRLEVLFLSEGDETCGKEPDGDCKTSLDIQGNTALKTISLYRTDQPRLDTRGLELLESLELAYNGRLADLDLTTNRKLAKLMIFNSPVASLNLSHNADLGTIYLTGLPIKNLKVDRNIALQEINIADSPLASLDLSRNTALAELTLWETEVTTLDLRCNNELHAIEVLGAPLSHLTLSDQIDRKMLFSQISDTRLPLSCLAQMTGPKTYNGVQRNVFFEQKTFPAGEEAVLDLSSEAVIDGAASHFTLVEEFEYNDSFHVSDLVLATPKSYSVNKGLVSIKTPGRYHVLMTSPKILNYYHDHKTTEIPVLTGLIVVEKP